MLDKPAFIVIAGPNGSGKSFFSSRRSDSLIFDFGIKSFDFDLSYSDLYKNFLPIMTPQIKLNLSNRVKEISHENINFFIQNRLNFSFQTNFDIPYSDKWREVFKNAGYKTYLYFLYLNNTEICKSRVKKRVLEGGHFVDENTIENRYYLGLENFDTYFEKYDEVNLINTSDSENIYKLLKIEDSKVIFLDNKVGDVIFKDKFVNLNKVLQSYI